MMSHLSTNLHLATFATGRGETAHILCLLVIGRAGAGAALENTMFGNRPSQQHAKQS